MPDGKILLSWEVKSEQKSSNAKIVILLIFITSIAASIYFVILKDYFSVSAFVVLALVLIWYAFSTPKPISVVITDKGIGLGDRFYKLDSYQSFWVSERSKFFYLKSKGRVGPILSFPSGNKNPEEIKKCLPENLIEVEDRGDDFSNRMADIFKI